MVSEYLKYTPTNTQVKLETKIHALNKDTATLETQSWQSQDLIK